MILSGMGELHLDIVCDRIRRDFNVSVTLGALQVSYREAPSRTLSRSGLCGISVEYVVIGFYDRICGPYSWQSKAFNIHQNNSGTSGRWRACERC